MTLTGSSDVAIAVHQLGIRLGRNHVLREVTLEIPTGAIFALIGPNGAGKTTLLKTLMNMHRPAQGQVSILGRPSTKVKGYAFEQIGYVSENQEMPGWMTLEAFLAYLRPFYPQWDEELERSLVTQFRLPRGRKLKQMSRGQQMKAMLLAALAYKPALLILDEPFSGLDPLARDEFIAGMLDRAAAATDQPMTVLLSSHDLAEIESFSTHIAYLNEGRVMFAEEVASLTERFRDVTVTLGESTPGGKASGQTPPSWLLPECSAAAFHFVHSAATTEPMSQQIAAVLPGAREIQADPMSLRSIFLALARSAESAPTFASKAGSRG